MNFRNEQLLQRVTSEFFQQVTTEFLQRATSATNNERISQRLTSEFLQQATSATSHERILQRVTSEFLQRATSNEWISTSNEQRVKSYISLNYDFFRKYFSWRFKNYLFRFSKLSKTLFELNQFFNCFISRLTSLFRFFTDLFVWKRFISSAELCILQCWIALWGLLRREVVLDQNLVVHLNLLALNPNYNHWWKQNVYDLTSKT